MRTVALVSCLARLHDFCIDEVERGKDLNRSDDTLPADLEHGMNQLEGYVPMIRDDNHDVPIPYEIMDGGNHFDDCPRSARQSRRVDVVANNELPRTMLLKHVMDSHKTRPHANMRTRKKNI